MTYTVFVDDNFHYMDESERYKYGEFDTCEAALAACKHIVDECLISFRSSASSAGELMALYATFGDDPFISAPCTTCRFSARDYARQRCNDLIQPTPYRTPKIAPTRTRGSVN